MADNRDGKAHSTLPNPPSMLILLGPCGASLLPFPSLTLGWVLAQLDGAALGMWEGTEHDDRAIDSQGSGCGGERSGKAGC